MSDSSVLYAPPPRTRQSRRRGGGRRVGDVVRVCCYMMALVGAGVTCVLLYSLFRGAHGFKQTMDFPHIDLVDTNASSTAAKVWPLVNATTAFQVRATVWLDVTQHLQQGGTLPVRDNGLPMPVVTYAAGNDTTRSEAILYSDVVAKMDGWRTPQYKDLALRIPIEPLYTQDLGPSTLRLTTQVEVEDDVVDGKFIFASSIFPPSTALLPRSPTSPRITYGLNDTEDHEAAYSNLFAAHLRARTINEALEHTASSTGLLSLMHSKMRVNDSLCPTWGGNVESLMAAKTVPPFLDGATINRRFAQDTVLDDAQRRLYLHGRRCQLFVPHIRAKASVFVLSSLDKPLQLSGYAERQRTLRTSSVRRCLSLAEASSPLVRARMLNGDHRDKCDGIRGNGALETCLMFSNTFGADEVTASTPEAIAGSFSFRYAPVLWMRTGAAAEQDHHTIPRVQPVNRTVVAALETHSTRNSSPKCQLPVLQADATMQFFDVTLQLRIASAKGLRLQLTDSFSDGAAEIVSDKVAESDEVADMRINGSHANNLLWETANVLAGDRSHPQSKPLVRFFASLSQVLILCALMLLTFGYWYTRTTTAGLCVWAQWVAAASLAGEAVLSTYRWIKAKNGEHDPIGEALTLVSTLVGLVLLVMVLLRVEVTGLSWRSMRATRRPMDKAERQCRMAESKVFGWYGAVAVLMGVALYEVITRPGQRILRDGHGCFEQDYVMGTRWTDVSMRVLEETAVLGQMLFNVVSPAVHDRRRRNDSKNGSFAGNFKLFYYLSLADSIVQLLVGNVTRIGGHLHRRAPLYVMHIEVLLVNCVGAYQAWTLPGVPQRRDDEGEDDDDDDGS